MMFEHKSVLLAETIESLRIRPDGVYVDGTLGGGGHAFEVLKRLSDKGRLIGMDQDADAIAAASKRLSPFGGRAVIVRSNYEQMGGVLSARWTGSAWIWGFRRISSIRRFAGFLTGRTPRWICAWISAAKERQRIW